MSRSKDNTFQKAGQISVQEGKKGLEFFAFNHQHGEPLHIGTLSGSTYEKTAPILNKPEPSFCLPHSELAAVEQAGGRFIRFIGRGRPGTFAISLADFRRLAVPYHNPAYGEQWRVPLGMFQRTDKVSKRNAMVDSPPIEREADPIREKQLTLLGWMR